MVRRHLIVLTSFVALGCAVAFAQKPPALQPPPPGTIVQNLGAYLAGDAMHSRYQVVTSRKQVGTPHEIQWTLSVYGPAAGGLALRYQSPSAMDPSGLVPKLEQGVGTKMYFPRETLKLAGKGELMGEARDQVLALVSAAAADCGSVTLAVLDAQGGTPHVSARVDNPCDLRAKIQHHTIVLSGPYYNKNAALCCPTKNHAVATLRYINGRWVEKPAYFKLSVPRQAVPPVSPLTSPSPLFTPIFKAILTTPAPSGPPQPPR